MSLQAFLRLFGRFREMTRGLIARTPLQHKKKRHRHRGSPLDYMIFFQDTEIIIYREFCDKTTKREFGEFAEARDDLGGKMASDFHRIDDRGDSLNAASSAPIHQAYRQLELEM